MYLRSYRLWGDGVVPRVMVRATTPYTVSLSGVRT